MSVIKNAVIYFIVFELLLYINFPQVLRKDNNS